MYYPLSQITTDLYTSQEEFLVQSTNLPYKGKYYSTSDGKFFTGATPQDGSNFRLIRNTKNDSSKDVEIKHSHIRFSPKNIKLKSFSNKGLKCSSSFIFEIIKSNISFILFSTINFSAAGHL